MRFDRPESKPQQHPTSMSGFELDLPSVEELQKLRDAGLKTPTSTRLYILIEHFLQVCPRLPKPSAANSTILRNLDRGFAKIGRFDKHVPTPLRSEAFLEFTRNAESSNETTLASNIDLVIHDLSEALKNQYSNENEKGFALLPHLKKLFPANGPIQVTESQSKTFLITHLHCAAEELTPSSIWLDWGIR